MHEWTGLGPYVQKRVQQLAGLGYVAFGADIYGKGVRPDNPKDAAAIAGKYKGDRHLMRDRVLAGLAELRRQPQVDPGQDVTGGRPRAKSGCIAHGAPPLVDGLTVKR